jgi:E3 ubiquitin-protein ligase TRIP12
MSPVSVSRRQELFFRAFTAGKAEEGTTPLAVLVKKLQESLTRMESYEVITVSHGSDDNKRSSPSLLARQLRLRLVASDESDIPPNLNNIVVSIHAIATFQALHDYLRPRVSGLLTGGSRLLAALAAGFGAGSSSRPSLSHALPLANPLSAAPSSSIPTAEAPVVTRRRSQRLSAKKSIESPTKDSNISAASSSKAPESNTFILEGPSPAPTISDPSASTSVSAAGASEMAPSDTVVGGDDDHDDFSDEDVDAEVVDDEMDPDSSMHDKTITLSVADGIPL